MMEDPKERDRKFREHVYAMKDRCKRCGTFPSALTAFGHLSCTMHRSAKCKDEGDPHDDLLPQTFESSSK